MEITVLLDKPKLSIQSSADGVWLHFSAASGLSASLNLPAVFDGKNIIDSAIRDWCIEFATKEGK